MKFGSIFAITTIASVIVNAAPTQIEKRANLLDVLFSSSNIYTTSNVATYKVPSQTDSAAISAQVDTTKAATSTSSDGLLGDILGGLGKSSNEEITYSSTTTKFGLSNVIPATRTAKVSTTSAGGDSVEELIGDLLGGSNSTKTSKTSTSASSIGSSTSLNYSSLDDLLSEFLNLDTSSSTSTGSTDNSSHPLQSIIKSIFSSASGTIDELSANLTSLGTTSSSNSSENLKSLLGSADSYVDNFFSELTGSESLSSIIGSLLDGGLNLVEEFFSSSTGSNLIDEFISLISSSASKLFSDLLNSSSGLLGSVLKSLLSDFESLFGSSSSTSTRSDGFGSILSTIVGFVLSEGESLLKSLLGGTSFNFSSLFSSALKYLLSHASQIFKEVFNLLSSSGILNWLEGILKSEGASLFEKLINFLEEHFPTLGEILQIGLEIGKWLFDDIFGSSTSGSSTSGSSTSSAVSTSSSGSSFGTTFSSSSSKLKCCCSPAKMKAKMLKKKKRELKKKIRQVAKRSLQMRAEITV